MKLKALSLLAITLTGLLSSIGKARIPIPYGEKQKIVKIVDLPDTEDFQLDDGTYFDIGKMYTISHIVWLPYSSTDAVLTGYVDDETYVELTPEQIKEIAAHAKVEIPENVSPTFFDRIGGKIVLGLIVAGAVYFFFIRKSDDDEEDEVHDIQQTEEA